MKKIIIVCCLSIVAGFISCKKNDFNGVSSQVPDLPVTVTNPFGIYNGVPTVSTSVTGGGAITITMEIPAESARTIKEITRVGIATTPNNYRVVETPAGLYNAAAIPGKNTSVSFTTSLAEYTAKTGLAAPSPAGTATSFLARYFIFQITLDNGDQVYPLGVRVYVGS